MKPQILLLLCGLSPLLSQAENSAPLATGIVDTIPAARDVPWPGVINLSVDASDVTRGIFQVREAIPVPGPGPLTLLYPKWLPGHHSPLGQIANLAGLNITASGRSLAWQRDPVDVFAFHVDAPAGTSGLEVQFQFLAPTDTAQGRIVTTPEMLNLQWNDVALYPAGYYVRQITVAPSVIFPAGWKAATALEVATQAGTTVQYRPVTFETLVDSPIFAGANVRVETLAPGVRLNIFADQPEQLAATEEELQAHRNLITQALKLFGAQHYDRYDFLLGLSARLGAIGLEHHRSSENGVSPGYFTEWKDESFRRDILAHEYAHSWNGKFRRPADLWTPDYRTPMQDGLLWLYEGQTQLWGYVLAARSGLISLEDTLGAFAARAAFQETQAGRQWRPLADTTNDPTVAQRRPKPWSSWQRSEDYYLEGMLIWIDVDSLLRELSHGQRSLDDFARAFFGVNDGDWGELTYTFDDIPKTLNQIQPHDWAAFLRARLDSINPHAPLDGITRGGYKLVYTDTPTAWFQSYEKYLKITSFQYSGGFVLGKDGEVTAVDWDSPAFNAGLTVGSKLIAVNGRALAVDQLKADIKAKKSPLSLLVKTGDIYRTLELYYDGGLRYPKLERIGSGSSSLDALLAAKR
jgi:predicted metalloprotease with PDZ domain